MLLGNHEEMNITGIALDYPGYVTVEQFLSFLPEDFRLAREAEYIRTLPPEERKSLPGAADRRRPPRTLSSPSGRGRSPAGTPRPGRPTSRASTTTYGDWLMRKNIVIKINDVVYAHAGISETFSRWPLREINTVMRSELEFFQGRMRNPQQVQRALQAEDRLRSGQPALVPRPRHQGEAAQAEIDRILANLEARAMVVGHSYFYNRLNGRLEPRPSRRDVVARFQDKVWIMDTGISGSYGGVPSALIYRRRRVPALGRDRGSGLPNQRPPGADAEAPGAQGIRGVPQDRGRQRPGARARADGPTPGGSPWNPGARSIPALFRYVDRRRPDPLPDSYKYDLAAYALDKYLGLGFVPPIVERAIAETRAPSRPSSATPFRKPSARTSASRPRTRTYYERAMADLLVFQNLVYDDCRNEKDTLISGDDGQIYRVDFSEAFAPKKDDVPHCPIRKCSRLLYRKLLAWDDRPSPPNTWAATSNADEIGALNARRKIVVRLIQKQIKVNGEANVLF